MIKMPFSKILKTALIFSFYSSLSQRNSPCLSQCLIFTFKLKNLFMPALNFQSHCTGGKFTSKKCILIIATYVKHEHLISRPWLFSGLLSHWHMGLSCYKSDISVKISDIKGMNIWYISNVNTLWRRAWWCWLS